MLGGSDDAYYLTVVIYNLADGTIKQIAKLKNHCNYSAVAKNGDEVTIIGGSYYGEVLSHIEVLSLKDNTSRVMNATYNIQYATAHAVGSGILIVGGIDDGGRVTNDIKLLKKDGTLHDFAVMKEARYRHCSILHEEMLFVLGGADDYKYLSSCETVNTRTRAVTRIASMNEARSYAACVFHPHYGIIVTGGWGGEGGKHLSSVEVLTNNTWSALPSMTTARGGHSACICNGKLYVIGGRWTPSVECYDFDTRKWKVHGKLPSHKAGASVFPW